VNVLEIEQLSKRYGQRQALDGVSFALQAGEVVGFLGPNGAGKTTTMRCVVGLISPSAGSVRVMGGPVPGPGLRSLGAIIEEPSFYPYLSGRENLEYAAGLFGGIAKSRLDEVLSLVSLTNRAKDRVHKYSQGMRQRLGLARALLCSPKLLLLDEPTNGLDPEGVAELREIIKGFGQAGITVLVSSHILAEIERIARRVLIIDKGKLLADGPLNQLLGRFQGGMVEYRLETSTISVAQAVLSDLTWVSRLNLVGSISDGALQFFVASQDAEKLAPVLVGAGVGISQLLHVSHENLEDAYLDVIRGGDNAIKVGGGNPVAYGGGLGA
jgi:ABC-type multidrug transport system ATPase subunit